MHQLLETLQSSTSASALGRVEMQQSIQISELISLSSFETVKFTKISMPFYIFLIIVDFGYLLLSPAQLIVLPGVVTSNFMFTAITLRGAQIVSIAISALVFFQALFVFLLGRQIKQKQNKGDQKQLKGNDLSEKNKQTNLEEFVEALKKASGIFLTILSTALFQIFLEFLVSNLSCTETFQTINGGCNTMLSTVTIYISIVGIALMVALVAYSDLFLTRWFPDVNIPWAAWSERSRILRNLLKLVFVVCHKFIPSNYNQIVSFLTTFISAFILVERYLKPSIYNRVVHIFQVFLESILFIVCLGSFFALLGGFYLSIQAIAYISLGGIVVGIMLLYLIETKKQDIVSVGTDMKNFRSIFFIELYLVVLLHELERLVLNEDYGQEKHIHATISRHMEECKNETCPCKNYEPEYDKKFVTVGSKRLSKSFSTVGGSGTLGGSMQTLQDLKKLPYKITYKTKLEIFKKEFENRVDLFLEHFPKAFGVKLLKSFFNHKYCESSFKALFVQLENSTTCKDFKGKVFIYHLKTQIQDEMKKSTESPLTIDINSLLIFEKTRLDFERNLEELSFNCQTFWTDLMKEEYEVSTTLETAHSVASKIIEVKQLFQKLLSLNPLCIDTLSTYALAYRYVLRDEQTFQFLVNLIQQIKGASKLEMMREQGVRFFDHDIYALLMVSGEIKELGRIRQANSSCKFVMGYDPKDLIGSRINKLMPAPYAQIHDRFLGIFLQKGKSSFLEKNQPLPLMTKEGYLQMTLFYIKPMVSLKFGLIFTSFCKILNKYRIADDSHEYVKIQKLCIILTDGEGIIHGMSQTCSSMLGMPPAEAKKQLSINENQPFNIGQLCQNVTLQEYEFELVKGCQLQIDTRFLNKERQYRREYPEIACKIGSYSADIGVHKFSVNRDQKNEICLYVMKVDQQIIEQHELVDSVRSNSINDELTYSIFSITTANSSVVSSTGATSKFKTFKSKIQAMSLPPQIRNFHRLSLLIFLILLAIAAANFAMNQTKALSFSQNLQVMNNLQILKQAVPEAAHAVRQMILIANNLVKTSSDELIGNLSFTKYDYYSQLLQDSSAQFEAIQQEMQTSLSGKVSFNSYMISIEDVQTNGVAESKDQSMQTSLNVFSSSVLLLSNYNISTFHGHYAPLISLQYQAGSRMSLSHLEQILYFVIENGLDSIVSGLHQIQTDTSQSIQDSSQQAAVIAISLACGSILFVIVLLPLSWPTLTHIEKISRIALISLNRLPEQFCQNETKACGELNLFLNMTKEGEKSTHQMIKKHKHRKDQNLILKLPKNFRREHSEEMNSSVDEEQEQDVNSDSEFDKSTLLKSQGQDTYRSIDSRKSRPPSDSTSKISKVTHLSSMKQENKYEAQQQAQLMKIKRGHGGGIELDFGQAKTSDLIDDDDETEQNENKELTEAEIKQREREKMRKELLSEAFRRTKIRKFGCLILTALIIALYFGITSYYLNLVHNYEKTFANSYALIGNRIQCYTNVVAYSIETMARGKALNFSTSNNSAQTFLDDCYIQEEQFHSMLIEGLTQSKIIDNFNALSSSFDGTQICATLQQNENIDPTKCSTVMNGILTKGLTETLFILLRQIGEQMLPFQSPLLALNRTEQLLLTRQLLLQPASNEIISLHEVYLKVSFSYMRQASLQIIINFFAKMNNYYNMLFGIFVGLLFVFQGVVSFILVKRLGREIIRMYHVVLLIPFSGRTQDDLNKLMLIKI